jgi:cyclopropane fatty-acyl-phospholipid synthase-like methyltransferase
VDTVISPKETMGRDNYLWVGASAAEAIIAALAVSRLAEVRRILDLPCGHGRVLRHLVKIFPDAVVDACDLDRDGVDFCAVRFGARPIISQ